LKLNRIAIVMYRTSTPRRIKRTRTFESSAGTSVAELIQKNRGDRLYDRENVRRRYV
jgi:hypothetical protein